MSDFRPEIQWLPIDSLIPYERNTKAHPPDQIDMLAHQIHTVGWTQPIVIDAERVIIAGHARRLAAQKLGIAEVPVVIADHLSPAEAQAARIADNRSAEAPWEMDMLRFELKSLSDAGFDLKLTGFPEHQIGDFFDSGRLPDGAFPPRAISHEPPGDGSGSTDPDDEAAPPPADPRTKRGHVYQLGTHRLMCGDATSQEDVDTLLNGERPDMVFTDPPYGMSVVKKKGMLHGVGIEGEAPSGVYRPIIGDDSTATAVAAYRLCAELGIKILVFWGANFYAEVLPPSSGWICWDKENGEDFFADGELAWTNLPKQLRIFRHQWKGMIKASERGEKRVHPTQKPVALAEWCFAHYGDPQSVLDLFGGSGSVLMACERTNRRGFMMELDPGYCDVIVERWEKLTGKTAELIGATAPV